MAILKPFRGYRPQPEEALQIVCPPYDVISSDEARQAAAGNSLSFLHVIKAEIDLPQNHDVHDEAVYLRAKENLQYLIDEGHLVQDDTARFYIYGQTLKGRTQYGLVACAAVNDYMNNVIKKHELTRPDKEEDRKNYIRYTNFHTEPVFFAYKDHERIDEIVKNHIVNEPIYEFFTDGDQTLHRLWAIINPVLIEEIEHIFSTEIPASYVADGHHRTAAAALVGGEKKANNPKHTGQEEYNYFLAIHFPASQLQIIDYNRVVKDLNGLSADEFKQKLQGGFELNEKGAAIYHPQQLHEIAMYIDGKWYSLKAKTHTYDDNDPIGVLDVTILTKQVLEPLLAIEDLRRSQRIDFIGGTRGLSELKRLVDSGDYKVAFALYPVSMEQLMTIADTDNIMPPKTTWFVPKLQSGLILHGLD